MAQPTRPPVQFRSRALEAELARRSRPGEHINQVAARDLERYYALLQQDLATIHLTEAEAGLIVDALNGVLTEPTDVSLLWGRIDDAIWLNGLDRKWGVDGAALVERLRGLTPGQAWALADAAACFWLDPNPTGPALRRVGLVRDPAAAAR